MSLSQYEQCYRLCFFFSDQPTDISISLPEIQIDLKDVNVDSNFQNNNLVANEICAINNIETCATNNIEAYTINNLETCATNNIKTTAINNNDSKTEIQDNSTNKFENLKEFLTFKKPKRISTYNNNSNKNNSAANKQQQKHNHINSKLINKDKTKEFKVPRGFQIPPNLKQRQNVICDFGKS